MFDKDPGDAPHVGGDSLPPRPPPSQFPAASQLPPETPVPPIRAAGPEGADTDLDEPWHSPGEVLATAVADITDRTVAATQGVCPVLPRFSGDELMAELRHVDTLRAYTETLTLHLVMEALERGVPSRKGLSAHSWLTRRCPWLAPAAVSDFVTVAHGLRHPLHAHLREQVISTGLPVRRAATILRALARVKPFVSTTPDPVPDDDTQADTGPDDADVDTARDAAGVEPVSEYESWVASLTDVAADGAFPDKHLRVVTEHMMSRLVPDKDHEAREKAAHEVRGVNESSLADGSVIRFIVTTGAEGAALFRSILTSPLAAPCPDENGPDPRTADQRRHDALFTVLRRGLAGGDSAPSTPKATVNVTINWDLLRQELTGTGRTDTGDVLSPETVRKMACDADIIPTILGTDREILDLGRAKRLVTPGQRRVLHHRGKHCTFPECSTPAPWCDAHHVQHWSRGGRSDITNYALLCGRHHTIVHDKDLTATVHTTGVTWHV